MPLLEAGNVNIATDTTTPATAIARREHCKITAGLATALGIPTNLPERVQVRVYVTAMDVFRKVGYHNYQNCTANFTVAGILAGSHREIRLYPDSEGGATGGVRKLYNQATIPYYASVTVRNTVPSQTTLDGTATTHFTDAGSTRFFVEHARTGTGDVLIFAPHGEDIERGTSEQLEWLRAELAGRSVTPAVWECRGAWGNGETSRRWHITSTDLEESGFPGLAHLVSTHTSFDHAVALHGFDWDEDPGNSATWRRGIVIGGRAPRARKEAIQQEIESTVGDGEVAFFIADTAGNVNTPGEDGDLADFGGIGGLDGLAAGNLVNRLSAAGIQLEQSFGVRLNATLAQQVARAVGRAVAELVAPAAAAGG